MPPESKPTKPEPRKTPPEKPASRTQLIDRLKARAKVTKGLDYVGVSPIFLHGVNPGKSLAFTPANIWSQIAYLVAQPVYQPGANWRTVADVLNLEALTTDVTLVQSEWEPNRGDLAVVTIRMKKELQ